MAGPKPNAHVIFSRIHVELLRLRVLCDTQEQNDTLDKLEQVFRKVTPLWITDFTPMPVIRRTTKAIDDNLEVQERLRRYYAEHPLKRG